MCVERPARDPGYHTVVAPEPPYTLQEVPANRRAMTPGGETLESKGNREGLGVGVLDHNPVFVRGLSDLLAGADIQAESLESHQPDGLRRRWKAIVVDMDCVECQSLAIELRSSHACVSVVGLLSVDDADAYLMAIKSGASTAIPRKARPSEIRRVIAAVLRGSSILPVQVVSTMGVLMPRGDEPHLQAEDRELLQAIANGKSVRDLAIELHYSERSLHRKLRALYDRIGAANRADAVALVARWGVVGSRLDVAVDLRNKHSEHIGQVVSGVGDSEA